MQAINIEEKNGLAVNQTNSIEKSVTYNISKKQTKISFGTVFGKKFENECFLDEIIPIIRDGFWQEKVLKIRNEKDPEEKAKLKASLPVISSAICKDGVRKNSALIQAGCMIFDLDKFKDASVMQVIKDELAKEAHITFESPSGNGLKVIYTLDTIVNNVETFTNTYKSKNEELKKRFGTACTIDHTHDPVRLCFVSADADIRVNENASELKVIAPSLLEEALEEAKVVAFAPCPVQKATTQASPPKAKMVGAPTGNNISKYGDLLSQVNPDTDYNTWLDMGISGKNIDDACLGIWDNWSKASTKYKSGECQNKWVSFEQKMSVAEAFNWLHRIAGIPTMEEEELLAAIEDGYIGLAKYALKYYFHNDLKYSITTSNFDIFNGIIWEEDKRQDAGRHACDFLISALRQQAVKEHEKERRKVGDKNDYSHSEYLNKIIDKLNNPPGRESIVRSLQMIGINTIEEDYDSDNYKINLLNGVYDLLSNQLIENMPSGKRLFKNVVNANYNPKAECPEFLKFLNKILDSDEKRNYVQKFLGVGLSGEMIEKLLIFYGAGSNGKSTLIKAIKSLMDDYTTTLDVKTLIGDHGNKEYELRKLKGARLAVLHESKKDEHLDDAVAKKITSKDPVTARNPYEKPITFDPTHKAILLTNNLPKITATDKGTWRRIALIKFDYDFDVSPDKKRDSEVEAMFEVERDGILMWLIEGWRKYKAEGIEVPASIRGDTEEFRNDNDSLLELLSTRLTVTHQQLDKMLLSDVFEMIKNVEGIFVKSSRELSKELKSRGFIVATGAGNHTFVHGLKVKPAF